MSIVTLTMNPAIDIASATGAIGPIDKMRCATPRYDPGGGGINVARTAAALGEPAIAIFPAGGYTGRFLTDLVRETGVPARAVPAGEPTRESLSVTDTGTGSQYRFVFPGPRLTPAEQHRCLATVEQVACGARYLVASGSLPPGVPVDYYQRVSELAGALGVPLIVDTSGPALRAVRDGVFLLKPSLRELADRAGRPLTCRAEQVAAARELITGGVTRIVVVSLGSAGALSVTAAGHRWYAPMAVPVRSGIGAGDAMVGGLAVGLARGLELDDSVRLGMAAATAALTTPGTGVGLPSRIRELYRELTGTTVPATPGTVERGASADR
ncbi:6-phosphofructokinase 2 [Nocardia transvalensis]|uniref:6-phosphofructokinase 2 n=1 Tax=Nocardia transvalensis TaxID=37333 RepID=A0A7W9PJ82_9NOCA|nr:1-phosphofructokinase family hexose kinase [Nocardia transvalensis]MBB5916723.1 6-phosphofructokinase 2 [Nocardia transvalensis]